MPTLPSLPRNLVRWRRSVLLLLRAIVLTALPLGHKALYLSGGGVAACSMG